MMKIYSLDVPNYYDRGCSFGAPSTLHEPLQWFDAILPVIIPIVSGECVFKKSNILNLIVTGASGVSLAVMFKLLYGYQLNVVHLRKYGEPGDHANTKKLHEPGCLNIILDDHIGTGRTLSNINWILEKKIERPSAECVHGIVTMGANLWQTTDRQHDSIITLTDQLLRWKEAYYPNMYFFTQANHMNIAQRV